jgi:hypothetical protein
MSPLYTRELLNRCTARELVILAAAFGIEAVARRMGLDVQNLLEKTNSGDQQ